MSVGGGGGGLSGLGRAYLEGQPNDPERAFTPAGLARMALSGAPTGLSIASGRLLVLQNNVHGATKHRSAEIVLSYTGAAITTDYPVTLTIGHVGEGSLLRNHDNSDTIVYPISAAFTIKAPGSYDYEFEFRTSDLTIDSELTIAEGETLVYYARLKPADTATLPGNLTVNITGHEDTDLIFNRPTHYTVEPRQVNKESWKVMSITAKPDDDARDDTVELMHKACCLGDKDFETYAEATLTVTVDEDKRISPVPPAPVTPSVPPPVTPGPDPDPAPDPQEENELDRDALEAIYDALGGDTWNRKDNWDSMESIGGWQGVTADEEGRVVALDLSGNNLSGNVAGEVADLSELEKLDLSDNPALTGELPSSLTGLANLTELYIDGTQVCPPDDDAFRTWLDGLATFSGNDSCDGETEQPEDPVGEVEESGGGCAVASGGVGESSYSLVFALFVLAAVLGASRFGIFRRE